MKQRMISIPFFLLRGTTAGAAFVTGLLQTYVFAHILSPQRFSIFILVAAFGYSLWLIDFGIVKILFVRLRAKFLSHDSSDAVAGHATAVVLFYFLVVTSGASVCFVFMATQTEASVREAAEFGLFFSGSSRSIWSGSHCATSPSRRTNMCCSRRSKPCAASAISSASARFCSDCRLLVMLIVMKGCGPAS